MKLYHGGTLEVNKPVILKEQRLLDFGNGFYTISNKKQAENGVLIKQKRKTEKNAIVSVYNFSDTNFRRNLFNIKLFETPTEEWLNFIVDNRRGLLNHSYDIVQGAVANDTLYATLLLYENEILTKSETIIRLKTHKLFDQISFYNKETLTYLKFIYSYSVKN